MHTPMQSRLLIIRDYDALQIRSCVSVSFAESVDSSYSHLVNVNVNTGVSLFTFSLK